MSTHSKSPLEEEFEKYFSSEKGAWTNAWSPSWEDTAPLESTYFGNPWEDSPAKTDFSAASDQEKAS
jgi:hypothetical protein